MKIEYRNDNKPSLKERLIDKYTLPKDMPFWLKFQFYAQELIMVLIFLVVLVLLAHAGWWLLTKLFGG